MQETKRKKQSKRRETEAEAEAEAERNHRDKRSETEVTELLFRPTITTFVYYTYTNVNNTSYTKHFVT